MMNRSDLIDLAGKKFGAWTVLYRTENDRNGATMWMCKCDCGTVSAIRGSTLKSGKSTGCHACLWNRQLHPAAHTDGSRRYVNYKETRIFRRWRYMKSRCYDPKNKSYKHYGGRGIAMCDEWKNSFQAYFDYVSKLEHFGEPGYTLDRIDNNGNYEPGNVRYSTRSEQEHNKRAKRLINSRSEEYSKKLNDALIERNITRKEFAQMIGVGYPTVHKWIHGRGLPSNDRLKLIEDMFNITV